MQVLTFEDNEDFGAYTKATKYLENLGYTIGSMESGYPTGFAKGFTYISKWNNMTGKEHGMLDGTITASSFRNGVVTVTIK